MINKLNIKYIFIIFFIYNLNAQNINDKLGIANNSPSLKRVYTTDVSGNLFMYINIWGSNSKEMGGRIKVPEGIDMVELLSLIGGPKKGLNYKKIIIIRENPDKNNRRKVIVDMSKFFKNGDRSYMARILPNDTIIMNQKLANKIVDRLSFYSSLTFYKRPIPLLL